jgi:hypothetical protein
VGDRSGFGRVKIACRANERYCEHRDCLHKISFQSFGRNQGNVFPEGP